MSLIPIDKHLLRISGAFYPAAGVPLYVVERGDPDRVIDPDDVEATETLVTVYEDWEGDSEATQPLISDASGTFRSYWVAAGSYDFYVPDDPGDPIQPWEAFSGRGDALRRIGGVFLEDFGGIADGGTTRTAASTSGSAIITATPTTGIPVPFPEGIEGLPIVVSKAGSAGAALRTTILSRQSDTQITLATNASTTTNNGASWGTDNGPALEDALAELRDVDHGLLRFGSPGRYRLASLVDTTNVGQSFLNKASVITIQGNAGGSQIMLDNGGGLVVDNLESARVRDLVFLGVNDVEGANSLHTLRFLTCERAVVENCHFYGVVPSDNKGIVSSHTSGLVLRDVTFHGCSGVGPTIPLVNVDNWTGFSIENGFFSDFGVLDHITYSRTSQDAGSQQLAWVNVGSPADIIMQRQSQAYFRDIFFDEGAKYAVRIAPDHADEKVNSVLFEGVSILCGRPVGAMGITADWVRHFEMRNCSIGTFPDTDTHTAIELTNVDYADLDVRCERSADVITADSDCGTVTIWPTSTYDTLDSDADVNQQPSYEAIP